MQKVECTRLDTKGLFAMSRRKKFAALAAVACMLLMARTVAAESIAMSGSIGPSSTYYFGFDREEFDGTVIDGASYPGATVVPIVGSTSEMQRDAFLMDPAIAGLTRGTEDFEALSPTDVGVNGSIPLSFGVTGVTGTLVPEGQGLTSLTSGGHRAGRYPISGSQFVETNATNSETELTVTFDQPVAGFGFYATDSGDFDGRLKLLITQVDGDGTSVVEFTLPTPSGDMNRFPNEIPVDGPDYNASLLFFGLIDVLKPITTVTIVNVPDGVYFGGDAGPFDDDDYGFDDLIAVSAVTPIPEPASFGLLLLGGTALLGYSRRRSRSNAA